MIIAALVGCILVSIIIPLIIWFGLIIKNKEERKGIIILFIAGALFYAAMQFGIKQQGLAYLFNNANLQTFVNDNYIAYLFSVALAGALLAVIPEVIFIGLICKKKVTFKQAISMGLGYVAAESNFLIGYQGITTLIKCIREKSFELNVSANELFLSDFERLILSVTGTGLIVFLIYYMEQDMTFKGILIKVLCQAVVAFLPGFLIAFTTDDLLEIFDRSIALIMIYLLLSATAICAWAFLDSVKWKMYEK